MTRGRQAQQGPAAARLLAIAGEHLRRFGPRRITVVGIAEEAGMTHANVYRYFPSKAALIDALAGQWLKGLETTLAGIADAPDPAGDKLERLLLAIARTHRDLLEADPALFAVYAEATEAGRPLVRRHRARQRQLVDRVLEEGLAAGAFNPRDRERALAFLLDAVHRFTHPVAVRGDREIPRGVLDARLAVVLGIVLRALSARVL